MKRGPAWMWVQIGVAAGGILAAGVAAYLRRHEPGSHHYRLPSPASQSLASQIEAADLSPYGSRLWHPWVRINRVFRSMLRTRWDAKTWPITKAEMRKALELRSKIERRGYFN